ncbi:hypothetical protein PENPOL_c007G01356 [Penicillium polonicum]|uniref:Myb-like DNA-binding domain-containing protein n=1 Tax=Penicillium polonicum TaxID=60169 RepID=A0A1V6NJB3_PENPO|nr:hypothetical protein PENPOL_c007G01356 [Penicillium polonicum]
MAPVTVPPKAKADEPSKKKIKLNVKATDEEFLLTLLDKVKVDHDTASKTLGISKAACRMRFIRLQQKHGFKTKGKGTPRRQRAPDANKEATDEKEPEDTEEAIEN